MNRYAGKVLARCIELCSLFGSRFHVLFSGHARLSLGSSYVALVWPWLDFTFLGVQLRGLGVALVGFHIPNEHQVSYTSFNTGYKMKYLVCADAVNGINDSG